MLYCVSALESQGATWRNEPLHAIRVILLDARVTSVDDAVKFVDSVLAAQRYEYGFFLFFFQV